MEGISQEAISFAGHMGLGKLIVLFDDNGISIDGPISLSTSDDQILRFKASNWHTIECNGHSSQEIESAIKESISDPRPSLIACKTKIGFGSPNKEGKSSSHGAPMVKKINLIRRNRWNNEPYIRKNEPWKNVKNIDEKNSKRYFKFSYYHKLLIFQNKHVLNIEEKLELQRKYI